MNGKGLRIRMAACIGCLGLLGGLAGCGGKLSDAFVQEEVQEKAEEIVEMVSQGELEQVYEEEFNVVMQNGLELQELEENLGYLLKDKGELTDFKKVEIKGTKDKDTGTEYATAMVLAQYEEGNVMFTISFDTDMKCAGFYMK